MTTTERGKVVKEENNRWCRVVLSGNAVPCQVNVYFTTTSEACVNIKVSCNVRQVDTVLLFKGLSWLNALKTTTTT